MATGASPRAQDLSTANQATPDGLVREALERNPELNFYAGEIAAAKGGLRTAGTTRNPEFNTQAGYKNVEDKSGSTLGEGAAFSISVSQTFEYPGRIAMRKAIARGDIDLAELHLERFRIELAARVRMLAYSIDIAREKSSATHAVAERFRTLSDVAAQRAPAGVTPLLEMRLIDANAFTLRRQERDAALWEQKAKAELNQLRGQPVAAEVAVASTPLEFVPASLPVLLNAARKNAFDIRIRKVELAQHGARVSLSKNERYPAIAVGPFYSQENSVDKEQQVGIGVSVPLPFWDRNAGNIEAARAREQQAQASLSTTERQVERQVVQSAAILRARAEEIETWQADTASKFRDAAELADSNYRLGGVPTSIYVEMQRQYLEVFGAGNEMKLEALQAAQELETLTGLKLYRERSDHDR